MKMLWWTRSGTLILRTVVVAVALVCHPDTLTYGADRVEDRAERAAIAPTRHPQQPAPLLRWDPDVLAHAVDWGDVVEATGLMRRYDGAWRLVNHAHPDTRYKSSRNQPLVDLTAEPTPRLALRQVEIPPLSDTTRGPIPPVPAVTPAVTRYGPATPPPVFQVPPRASAYSPSPAPTMPAPVARPSPARAIREVNIPPRPMRPKAMPPVSQQHKSVVKANAVARGADGSIALVRWQVP